MASGSLIRPAPTSPSASSPASGPIELDAARTQRARVGLSRLVLPHAGVHRRRDEHRAAVRERRLGENVVGEPVRELRERVRGQRRDHEQVGALEVRVGIGARGLAREREERLGRERIARRPCVGSGSTS